MSGFENFWAVYSNLILGVGTNSLLAISIWLTLSCGMLAMGNAAFMGIGAYSSAILTVNYGVPFAPAVAAGIAIPALTAFVIGRPTLKLSGVYLAMATLAFGEVVRIAVINAEKFTGGALGLNGIEQLTRWWHIALALFITILALWKLKRSKLGRAFEAIKEDETAAGLMGIDVAAHKMSAFVLGAGVAGLAGALNAHLTFFIGPNEFGFDRGIEILTMAVFGGIDSLVGPILGAIVLTLLPEFLRGFADYRLMVNGFILVVTVLYLPRGIWHPLQLWQRRRGGLAV